jgi:ABC-type bacteriocin/lantibiotic exporter with double-glycine peptidase domain
MTQTAKKQKSLVDLVSASELRKSWEGYVAKSDKNLRKATDHPPSWVRFIAGALGFFSSLLALGVPAIALLVLDRLVPSGNMNSLWALSALGLGTAVSVCLIDLMRMRALENYFTNVRGLVLYQDSCFAIFWMLIMGFLSPLLPLVSMGVGAILFLVWYFRKPHKIKENKVSQGSDADPLLADAVGLGSAYLQQAAEGKIYTEDQPDFQTIGQTSWLNFIQLVTAVLSIVIAAWLHISGSISLGTMIAVVFLNQYITGVFVKFYQVQALKPAKQDLSFIQFVENSAVRKRPPSADDEMALLSISEIEGFGFSPFSADLFQGLCLALIGPSGSGKSEILRAIATGQFLEGKISYKGQNWGRNHGRLTSLSYAATPPIVLQGTVVENVICFDPKATALPAIDLLRKLDPFEDVFRDKDFINEKVDEESAAQCQVVSLARAFWLDSDIIILDGPETYLDKASRSALMALILRAKTEGKIVILATDDDYLMSVADEVVKLERGEVTDRGPMDEVLGRYHQRWVRVSFMPTKREAFRLSLWLEAQFPRGMDEALKTRVKQTAQDMLFFAPRDQNIGHNEEILFDVRMSPHEVFITMHDRGDVLSSEHMSEEESTEYNRVIGQSDGFEQTLREGYRQLAVRFSEDRSRTDDRLIAES